MAGIRENHGQLRIPCADKAVQTRDPQASGSGQVQAGHIT
eukprot:CAMPEP_0174296270 /NCGR_PEP_ID=MMETSP0809-20121228/47371_1 /TAXON_ID=73025 ORGANISM="Eutreptiella gymnastica-like, Strain CCMP1594" /NCGR_SAMPLE_ID=MMETSP0809 /ASSEMBLY_ACC=CAM_ASM_000658 /LENGTH=39 /DNA_ID= /DNA_START= /DNA_END= /DNA_ORIENTATION=